MSDDKRASLIIDSNQKGAAPDKARWPYPWARDEDLDYHDPLLCSSCYIKGTKILYVETLRDLPEYAAWHTAMREKYGYPRKDHVRRWEPPFREWLAERRRDA